MASRIRVLFFILLIVSTPMGLFAQARLTGADLMGVVQDQTGAALPGVTITATHEATNQSRTVTTDKEGRYYIGALQPGLYTLSADLTGFAPQKRTASGPRSIAVQSSIIFPSSATSAP